MEYGFKPIFAPSAPSHSEYNPQELSYPPNEQCCPYPPTSSTNFPKPVYPLLPPESSPCSTLTNFRPIHPLNEHKKAYYWVDTHANGTVPSTAIQGGVDIDGEPIYVGRAYHEGDWIPAKVIPGRNVAYISYDGHEYAKETFQVLCEQRFKWVPTSGANIPPGAVEGGRTCDGEILYIGRVIHNESQTVGKVHPSHGCCYIPFNMEEKSFPEYEILVLES
ncbi:uncharacterized protein LOC109597034 [Aethina tumida]|uniref:uncharacterized protein LOC109597034 n=1 Tax=Aethina tumida TaxID=116153 RepID=UPI00096B4ACC|nr:uncharacterized protein LOC109597034 [Aethina tumida]